MVISVGIDNSQARVKQLTDELRDVQLQLDAAKIEIQVKQAEVEQLKERLEGMRQVTTADEVQTRMDVTPFRTQAPAQVILVHTVSFHPTDLYLYSYRPSSNSCQLPWVIKQIQDSRFQWQEKTNALKGDRINPTLRPSADRHGDGSWTSDNDESSEAA